VLHCSGCYGVIGARKRRRRVVCGGGSQSSSRGSGHPSTAAWATRGICGGLSIGPSKRTQLEGFAAEWILPSRWSVVTLTIAKSRLLAKYRHFLKRTTSARRAPLYRARHLMPNAQRPRHWGPCNERRQAMRLNWIWSRNFLPRGMRITVNSSLLLAGGLALSR